MGIHPGYSGQQFMEETYDRVRRLRDALGDAVPIQVDGGVADDNIGQIRACGATLLVAATAIFGHEDIAGAYRRLVSAVA
jgi:ribulose-phosphate 3-epimerase